MLDQTLTRLHIIQSLTSVNVLDGPLPLVNWSLLSKRLPGLPLQDFARQHQLILSLDDDLLYLTHPDLLLRLLDGIALLHDSDPLVDDRLRILPVGIVEGHLGQGPQVFTVENTQSVCWIFGHRHPSQSRHDLGIRGHVWSLVEVNQAILAW